MKPWRKSGGLREVRAARTFFEAKLPNIGPNLAASAGL
jgi:hypothetical protein